MRGNGMRQAMGDLALAFGLVAAVAAVTVTAYGMMMQQFMVPIVNRTMTAGLLPGLQ